MTTLIDLQALPLPEVVETLDFETIFAAMLVDLRARDAAFTALVESDPAYKILEVAAYRETVLRQRINDAARRRLIAFATGADLAQLGAFYGVSRLVVDAGNPTASPPVPPTYESDDSLRLRIREKSMGSSAAGSASWYRYHALTAAPTVRDVNVDAPTGGNVRVSVLGAATSGVATAAELAAISDVVLSAEIRALCHTVTVVQAVLKPVNVVADITLLPTSPETLLDDIKAQFEAVFEATRGLGWDITQSWIIKQLQTPGVHHVVLNTPAATIACAPNECGYLQSVTLNFAGRSI